MKSSDQLEVVRPGPVSKYNKDMCTQIQDIAAQGGHVAQMMVSLGITSKETFYRWQNENPEFKEAYEFSKLISQAFYEKLGLLGVSGKIKDFNASSYALIMNNKFSDEYKRSGSGGTEITVNNNTLNLTSEQLDSKIAQKLAKVKLLQNV